MSYIFKKTVDKSNPCDMTDVEIVCHGETVSELCEAFKSFLMACEFPVGYGDLVTVEKEE